MFYFIKIFESFFFSKNFFKNEYIMLIIKEDNKLIN